MKSPFNMLPVLLAFFFFFFFFFGHMDDFKCQVKRNKEKVGNFQLKIVLFGNILFYSFLIKRYIIPYEKFEKVSSLETFIIWLREKLIFMLYREGKFATKKGETITFLRINYITTINNLPTIKYYWVCNHSICNDGIKNVMTKTRFIRIPQNLYFADNSVLNRDP